MGQDIELFNLNENTQLVSPCIIVHGQVSKGNDAESIQVQHPQLPPLSFPIHENHFKATIILTPGENLLTFVTNTNVSRVVTCVYTPLDQNLPIHLCVMIGRDSPMVYDSPKTQRDKEGGNNIDLAIKKLRVGARLMQAFTNEQMLRNGFGQRCFRFVEEYAWDTTFKQKIAMRNTVKIHILRSKHTTAELRDHNVAQQNPNGSDTGALFSWAIDAVKETTWFKTSEKPVQAAVMVLDAHWDGKFITGHAALGGGTDEVKMAVFGSHGLYSWPTCMEDLIPYFTDETRSNISEVANDCNECGTHWECLCVTLGAFLHEIGHSLGSPHQTHGVMLRDYVRLNRSFLTKEAFSLRTNSYGAPSPIYPKEECTWHRLDLLRYIFRPSCTIPQDFYDHTFMKPHQLARFNAASPTVYPLGNGTCRFVSETGIYCIAVIYEDLERGHMEFLPVSLGGDGPQREVILTLDQIRSLLPKDGYEKHKNDFAVKVMAVNSDDGNFGNFLQFLKVDYLPMDRFGLPRGTKGIKSPMLGDPKRGADRPMIGFNPLDIVTVRVYYGSALDGIRFYLRGDGSASAPKIPARNYIDKAQEKLKTFSIGDSNRSVIFGNETQNYADVQLQEGEYITGFKLRTGAWIDGIRIVTSKGRVTQNFGGNGGGSHELSAPSGQYILGCYGRVGQWMDGFGIVYGELPK